MEFLASSSQTTLLILLGASSWPFSREFQESEAFANAARSVKDYFLNPQSFKLPGENVLNLFDADHNSDELDMAIGEFLKHRQATMKADGNPARDLVLYFIGHGGFVGRDSDFYLAIRRTRMDNPRASGLQMMSLADTLTEQARHLRRFIILDCCFAAAAFSAFQAGPAQIALEKTVDAFEVRQKVVGVPTKGTTLLCSSNQNSPSLVMPDGSSTMFTKAFLDALVSGAPSQRDRLTLREVKDRAIDQLSEIRNAPRPVVHSPDQSEGDVADLPFFPNRKTEEQRLLTLSPQRASVQHVSAPLNPSPAAAPSIPQRRGLSRGTVILLIGLAFLVVVGTSIGVLWYNLQNPYPPFRILAFTDALSKNSQDHGWEEEQNPALRHGGTCLFPGEAYHVKASDPLYENYCRALKSNFSNFAFEVQMRIIQGNCGGILFRYQDIPNTDQGTFYYFEVCQNGMYTLLKSYNRLINYTSSAAIHTGHKQSNLMTVVANNSTFDLYVNHDKIYSINDSTYGQGKIGVVAAYRTDPAVASQTSPPSEVVFSDAKVWT